MDYAEVRDELDNVEAKDDIKLKVNAEGDTGLYLKKTSIKGNQDFFFIGLIDADDLDEVKRLIDEIFPE